MLTEAFAIPFTLDELSTLRRRALVQADANAQHPEIFEAYMDLAASSQRVIALGITDALRTKLLTSPLGAELRAKVRELMGDDSDDEERELKQPDWVDDILKKFEGDDEPS